RGGDGTADPPQYRSGSDRTGRVGGDGPLLVARTVLSLFPTHQRHGADELNGLSPERRISAVTVTSPAADRAGSPGGWIGSALSPDSEGRKNRDRKARASAPDRGGCR